MERKKIDDLFREGLAPQEVPYEEAHWEAMERKFRKGRRRSIIRMLGIASLSAAAVLVFFLIFKESAEIITMNPKMSGNVPEKSVKKNPLVEKEESGEKSEPKNAVGMTSRDGQRMTQTTNSANWVSGHPSKRIEDLPYRDTSSLHYYDIVSQSLKASNHIKPVTKEVPQYVQTNSSRKAPYKETKNSEKSVGSLTILAAPDLTYVRGAGNPAFSQNIGLLYTQPLTKRLSVSSGLLYARKNYNSPYSFYRPNVRLEWSDRPTDVAAVCDVIDVPIIVNYGVYSNSRTRVNMSAGISSYFMLREHYQFSYSPGSIDNSNLPPSYEVHGKNNHLFGVADFSVSVQRKINSNMYIGVRPFMKVPLTGIGYGQTKLESRGIAVTLDFNLGGKKN